MQWVGHGSFKREVPRLISVESWVMSQGHPNPNAPVSHYELVHSHVLILETKNKVTSQGSESIK